MSARPASMRILCLLVTFPPNESDFISDEGKRVLAAICEGISIASDPWLEKRQWSHDLISKILEKNQTPPRATNIHAVSMFDKQKRTVEKKPEVAFSGRTCSLFAKEPISQAPASTAAPESPHASPSIDASTTVPTSLRTAPNTSIRKAPSGAEALIDVKEEINNEETSVRDAAYVFVGLRGGPGQVIDLASPTP